MSCVITTEHRGGNKLWNFTSTDNQFKTIRFVEWNKPKTPQVLALVQEEHQMVKTAAPLQASLDKAKNYVII